MAVGNPGNFFRLKGRLVVNPSDVVSAFPHGGIHLGEVHSASFTPGNRYFEIAAEEFGGEVVDLLEASPRPTIAVVLREFDTTALPQLFPTVYTGTTGRNGLRERSFGSGVSRPTGRLASDRSVKLLFSPRAKDHHPAILFNNAIPMFQDLVPIRLSARHDFGIPMLFRAAHDSQGDLYQTLILEDITL